MRKIKVLVLTLALGVAGAVYVANGRAQSRRSRVREQSEGSVLHVGASCCTGGSCCRRTRSKALVKCERAGT